MDTPQAKAPALGGETGLLETQTEQRANATTAARTPLKWQRVLEAFLTGRSYHRFEAERELHDHCLHSTVSMLQGMGVTIDRRMERVRGFQGCPTEVKRYWLAPESRQKALELLGRGTPSPEPQGEAVAESDAIAGA